MTHDNFTTLLVALINASPWAVGLWLARKRRLEKAERERNHKSHRHSQRKVQTSVENNANERGKGISGTSSGDGND